MLRKKKIKSFHLAVEYNLELLNKVLQIRSLPVCHHGDQLKQSIKGTEEWDKEFHPFLILSVIASSYAPGKRENTICYKCINWKWKILGVIETKRK